MCEKEVFNMLALQWNIDDAKKAWFQDGKDEKSEEIAIKMLRKGKDFEEIQEFTDLPIQRIQELASTINV